MRKFRENRVFPASLGESRHASGWTLVEVLAGMILIGIVLIPIFNIGRSALVSDVDSGKRSQAVGLASAMLEQLKASNGQSFRLTSTVVDETGINKTFSIQQDVPVPLPGQSTGWQSIRYLSGADTGFSYNLTIRPLDNQYFAATVQIRYQVGGQSKQESLWTIYKK